jgi:hypothetical protein
MKFKIWSDLHTEFYADVNDDKFKRIFKTYFPPEEDDKNTILLLSGDVGTYGKYEYTYKRVFNMLSKRFKMVICVPGNHSWYKSEIWDKEEEFFKKVSLPKKIHYLDNKVVKVNNNTVIIGACLWADFDNENPIIMNTVQGRMNDYNIIYKPAGEDNDMSPYRSYHRRSIQAVDTLNRFKTSKQFIIDSLKEAQAKGIKNKIVVTHHAPSFQSIDTRYSDNSLNPAYCSNLEDIILDYDVTLWTHGHQHCSNDYMIGDTRVICNAFGYHAYETNPKFKHDLVFEI